MKRIVRRLVPAVFVATLVALPTLAAASPGDGPDREDLEKARQLLGGHWERRADLSTREVPTSVTDVSSNTPAERRMEPAMPSVDRIVTGKMTTLDYLSPTTRRFRPGGQARERRIPFVLTLPETDREEVPVVIFGHGSKTSRELVYTVADPLAEAGYATFAIDFPYHGARAICTSHADCAGRAWCSPHGQCRRPGGRDGRVRTVEAPEWLWPGGPSYPLTSGDPFLDLRDLRATRAHFSQALVDLMQSVRVLRGADWRRATGGVDLDGDAISYVGISLGAIIGADLAAVEPAIRTYVLNAAGGDFFGLIQDSETVKPRFERLMTLRQYERGTRRFADFRRRARALLRPVDPVDAAAHATREPYMYFDARSDTWKRAPDRRILIQMSEGDDVVPNRNTRMLASAMGLNISVYEPIWLRHHAFLRPLSEAGRRARADALLFLKGHR